MEISSRATQGLRMRKINCNMDSLNRKQYLVFGLCICLLVGLMSPFLITTGIVAEKNKLIKQKIETFVEMSTGFYETALVFVSFYDYISTQGKATLRTLPISTEWETIYEKKD